MNALCSLIGMAAAYALATTAGFVALALSGALLVLVIAAGLGVFRCPACRRVHDSQEEEDACVAREKESQGGCGCGGCRKGGGK